MRRLWTSLTISLLAAQTAYAQAPSSAPGAEPQGQADQAGTAAAAGTPPRVEATPTAVPPPKPTTSPVVNKWSATLYGFAELDMMYDTRQGINDNPGNPVLPHAGSYAGEHGRTTFSIRNSRLGFRFSSPEWRSMKASGMIETDFFGNTPNAAGGASEGGFYNSAGLRVRHANGRLETPYVDLLAGQYWQLFGWQPYFHPNTVEIQGVPGEVFSRTAQFRLSKTLKLDPALVELAVAAARPPQRDGGTPDGQGGLRFAYNGWKGIRTGGSTGTSLDPLMIGVSGVVRRFAIQPPAPAGGTADPHAQSTATGWGVSVDGLIPVIPATAEDRSNGLTLTGSWVRGAGIQDLYSGYSNGGGTVGGGQLAGSNAIDNGLAGFDKSGNLTAIDVRSFIVGAQYYLPVDSGRVWLAANYSQANSEAADLNSGAPKGAWKRQRWADACLFWDATPAVRFGLEYAWFENTFFDDTKGHNQRYQLSTFYMF